MVWKEWLSIPGKIHTPASILSFNKVQGSYKFFGLSMKLKKQSVAGKGDIDETNRSGFFNEVAQQNPGESV